MGANNQYLADNYWVDMMAKSYNAFLEMMSQHSTTLKNKGLDDAVYMHQQHYDQLLDNIAKEHSRKGGVK